MKGFIRFISLTFSFLIVIISIVLILYVANIISIISLIHLMTLITSTYNASMATIIVAGILGILGIITMISSDNSDEISKGGLILPLEIGSVCIANQTFENIIMGITKKYSQFKNVKVNVGTKENGLLVNIYVYITPDTVVADITTKLQQDVKVSVLKQTTVEVKEINIKVKGVVSSGNSTNL